MNSVLKIILILLVTLSFHIFKKKINQNLLLEIFHVLNHF